jgi:hypothetical protein
MTTIRRGIVWAVLGLLATAAETRADSPGEPAERLQPDGSAIRTLYGASSARPSGNVLATYSPPPKKL